MDEINTDYNQNNNSKIINDLKINLDFFNRIKSGTILWIKMPHYVKVKGNCEVHDERPFLVTKIDYSTRMVSGYYTTSNGDNGIMSQEKYKKYKCVISCQKYKLAKPSFVQFYRYADVPFKCVICILDDIKKNDYDIIIKKATLFRNKCVISNEKNMVLEIGDIGTDNNQLFLIFQHDYQYSYALKIIKTNKINFDIKKNPNYFKSNGVVYSVSFDETLILNNIDEYIIIDMIEKNQLKTILENRKEYKYIIKNGENKIKIRKYKKKK